MNHLATIGPKPDAEIVSALEEALARARSGETVGLVMVEVNAGSQCKTCTRIGRRDQIIYTLEYAKHACMREAFE